MSTARAGLLLLLSVLAACTGTGSSSGEPAPRAAQAAPAAAAVHTDPREARLSGAVVAPHADRIDDELHAGRLDLAHEGAALFTRRVARVQAIVADLLSRPFNDSD